MIGYLEGTVLFSDGRELILKTSGGIGYQIFCHSILMEGTTTGLYLTHVKREHAEELFAFQSLKEKKLFELLCTVRSVGPKSAYALIGGMNVNTIIDAIAMGAKGTLTQIPGIGPKAAAQIILDLKKKIQKFKLYDCSFSASPSPNSKTACTDQKKNNQKHNIVDEALIACEELGFKRESILPLAQKILEGSAIDSPEQLVHLVLKEM